LLKAGVNPNVSDGLDYSPLHIAAQDGDLELCRLLLAHRANPNYQMRCGFFESPFPLMDAAEAGHTDIMRLLLREGARVNAVWAGETALSMAVKKNREPAVRLLLNSGATIKHHENRPPLFVAAMFGSGEICRLLIAKGADPNERRMPYLDTPLITAASFGNTEALKALLSAGADPKIVGTDGSTPLMAAVGSSRLEAIKVLLERKVDLNVRNQKNQTALSLALDNGKEPIIQALRDAGAQP
jgi:ankyrin repeat protein